MAETGVIDAARQEQFVGKVVEQISGTMTTLLGAVGDRLGLFKNLAEQGPATSAELASRTNMNERYLREWLGGMATAGYLNYDGAARRFSLPAEHASVLAQENGPFFVGGMWDADEDAVLSSSRKRFHDRVTWATTTLVRLLRARLRMRAKPVYQTGCASKSAMSRKDCRRSLM
jgi:hypothetical protein